VRVLDDCSTPTRIRRWRRWKRCAACRCRARRVAVLGDMAELGAHSAAARAEVGRRAAGIAARPQALCRGRDGGGDRRGTGGAPRRGWRGCLNLRTPRRR
jgi:hypothetical protein